MTEGEGAAGAGIEAKAARLREVAAQLRDPELGEERAAELAREAAEIVSEAGNELERSLRGGDE